MREESVIRLRDKVLDGYAPTPREIYALEDAPPLCLRDAAAAITARMMSKHFDSCSIINARSGRCSEDCKWCAQSAHYPTNCPSFPLVSEHECLSLARHNAANGVHRFSPVTSGRAVHGKDLDYLARLCKKIKDETGIFLCASMGLLSEAELQTLYDAGVRRYHCNLETAPSFFPSLCSTHTQADKVNTIRAARRIGFEICSGGIIGMGESRRQRIEFALALREVAPDSIPLNILSPIKGTPLQDTPLISDDEILDTVAFLRFAHPRAVIRFAGGVARLSDHTRLEAMRIGITGGIVGDMLTTSGCSLLKDKELIDRAGLIF